VGQIRDIELKIKQKESQLQIMKRELEGCKFSKKALQESNNKQ
jgi:hypothetical protein